MWMVPAVALVALGDTRDGRGVTGAEGDAHSTRGEMHQRDGREGGPGRGAMHGGADGQCATGRPCATFGAKGHGRRAALSLGTHRGADDDDQHEAERDDGCRSSHMSPSQK